MGKDVVVILAKNNSMEKLLFDELCDLLSDNRKWCHDYRIVSDFKDLNYPLFWESYSYLPHETAIILTAYVSVSDTVNKFCLKKHITPDSVNVMLQLRTENGEVKNMPKTIYKVNPRDLTYTCNNTGYWILYKGERIYGVGTYESYYKKERKNSRWNRDLYAAAAKLEIQRILSGFTSQDCLNRIKQIDNVTEIEVNLDGAIL